MDAEDLLAQLPTPHDPSLVLVAEQVAAARNRLDQVPAGEQAAARKELAEWIDRWSRGVKDAGTGADARLRAGVRAAIAAALREAGPDATMRDGLPVLARLLGKYGV